MNSRERWIRRATNERRRFVKDGPKRRRRTRRELPYGQVRRWGSTVGNFRREREARHLAGDDQLDFLSSDCYGQRS